MSRYIFLFDLDSTITRQEILPTIAKKAGNGMYERMNALTESTMRGEVPFKQSFLQRVDLLKEIPVSEVSEMIGDIELNQALADFIREHKERCYIVTGNLDVWIIKLLEKLEIGQNFFSSKALVKEDYIQQVISVVDKSAVISQIVLPFIAIGDGNNDAGMIEAAEIGIGYGGVHNIASSVLECASHAVYDEKRLIEFLKRLV